jgi:hypothetical protein
MMAAELGRDSIWADKQVQAFSELAKNSYMLDFIAPASMNH